MTKGPYYKQCIVDDGGSRTLAEFAALLGEFES